MAELLHRLAQGEKGTPELSLRDDPTQETLRFSADASLAFPLSDISALKRDTSGAFRMTTTFMGLQGSQSPLPGYYLDHLAWKAVHEQSPVGDFLDMFSHRLTQFVWHIWRKYRYHISFRNGGVDAFSQRMYSLVGLGHRQLRDKLAINHSKMLAYSGILANPGRSPEIICGLVSHCFDLSEVTLQNWQRRKVDIEPDQQNSLGSYSLKNGEKLAGRSVLGNFVLGTRVPDLSGKFQLSITSLTRKQFLSFLPSGENFLPLTMFVSFILRDGTFCLRPQTVQLWLNQAKVTATSDLIQLRQGDEIQIGRLMMRVHLNRGDIPHYDEEMATPETIVTNRDMLTDTLLSTEGAPHYPGMTHRHQLADTVVNGFSADPLQALQSESLITTGDPLSGIAAVRPSAPLSDPASNGGINSPFMDLPPIYASPGDRNDDVSAAEMAQRHLAVTPLLRGLGGSLTVSNSDDADDFLEEAGRTLQAAIKGLLDLQQQRNSLSDKHLRPLEDNPLRLNMDYATALDVMFAEGKSPVHLAAPAAVSESLRNVRHHEEANRAAIVESLRVLLDAFSPKNLLRRFVQYRRSHELRQPLDDAGAWQMYSHYYEELASDRQQGFEMLFNEVYAQVYDRVLREKQREPEA
ncbi:type VI secretion system baseplate subunit TssG [Escherichia coli]|nr:type VI secretion system baseplate subunit TssG [Escherichia coli]EFD5061408.1 type VI secretion system baseplate subunit TssG [Escherichia coli]EFD9241786.1 type VI secretion system baseplate subunit TssG [Escherichia coli]EFE2075569.1 type VI secretion system baseplate subunit TssG [Escherichia coli]EFE5299361.1 type VI secretion system baseplate subunit TssG [Escherichia coli]